MSITPDELPDPNEPPIDTPASVAWGNIQDAETDAALISSFYVTLAAHDIPDESCLELTGAWMLERMRGTA